MQKTYETNSCDILIKFESGTHPLSIAPSFIQGILDLCNEYHCDTVVLSVERSYVIELSYRMDSIKLYWLAGLQRWNETYLAG